MRTSDLVLVAVLTLACSGVATAENYRSVGSSAYEDFELDVDSIARHGEVVRFRVRSTSNRLGAHIAYEGQIGVDCVQRTRTEYWGQTRYNDRPGGSHNGSGEMKTVFAGTRQALELDTVCALARDLPPMRALDADTAAVAEPSPEVRSAPSVAPPRSEPAPLPIAQRPYAVSTALVLNAKGHLLVSDVVVGGCARVEAEVIGGPARKVEVLARDITLGYALLRLPVGGGFASVPRSSADPTNGEAVTIVGFPSRGASFQAPSAAAGVMAGRTASGADRVATIAGLGKVCTKPARALQCAEPMGM